MNEIKCWRCERKLCEISSNATGVLSIRCQRCGATNRVPLPLDNDSRTALVFAVATT